MILDLDVVLSIHHRMIERSGGTHGVLSQGLLESALLGADHTFDGIDLYPTVIEKACWTGYAMIQNHPFVDGNKRMGMHLLALTLRMNDVDYRPTNEEVVRVGFAIASGEMTYEELVQWVEQLLRPTKQ